MSNLLKSKLLLGVMTVAVMFVGVVAVSATTAAASCSITSTLKLGSTGAQVVCLQTALGGLTADGNFGAKTKAAVIKFQTNANLTADGVFGAKSIAAWMGNQGNAANFPSGCTSASGFSTTNGASCAGGGLNLPTGCTSSSGFSPVTGTSCAASSSYPAGCTSASGYSPTTGMSCSGASNVVNSSAAGNISADGILGGFANTIVGVSDVNHQVAGFQLTGAGGGSNLSLNYATIQLLTQSGNSSRLTDYFSSVGIWENGVQIGSVPASSFSSNNISGINNYVYSASIPLSGGKVVAGQQNNFYVTVTAVNSMDSANYGAIWALQINNIRFTDGTGATLTYSPASFPALANSGNSVTFSFGSAANANNIVVNVSRSSSDANSHTVTVNTTGGSTSKVPLLQIGLTTQGGQTVSLNKIPVTFTASGTTAALGNAAVALGQVTNEVYLLQGTTVLDSESVASNATSPQTITFKISSSSPLLVSTPTTLTVAADINSTTGGNYTPGASIVAATLVGQSGNVSNGWDLTVGSPNGSTLLTFGASGNANTVIPGTANGQSVAFYSTGISVAETSDVCTPSNDSAASSTSSLSCVIGYTVTANGAPAYIPQAASSAAAANSILFTVKKSDGSTITANTSVSTTQVGTNATSSQNGAEWTIPAGTTAQFSANVILTDPNNAAPGQYRAFLSNVKWAAATSANTWASPYTFNLDATNVVVPGYTYIY